VWRSGGATLAKRARSGDNDRDEPKAFMSNVLPFRPRTPVQQLARCEVVAVAGDLLTLLEQLEDVSARAAAMGRPALEVERTVQHLLDAVSAVERALDCIGEGEQAAPA
jgi:hypothetical protein